MKLHSITHPLTAQVSDDVTYPDQRLSTNLVIGAPDLRKYLGSSDTLYIGVSFNVDNPTNTDMVFDAEIDSKHLFNLIVVEARNNAYWTNLVLMKQSP